MQNSQLCHESSGQREGQRGHSRGGSMIGWTQGLNGNERDEKEGGGDERHICPLLFRA